ncbi:teichoic acid biosynthesis protein, partial [Staphylococcus aureus]|nr:teichoic acid biosynthesis protein [Staphylococcus aureus]
DDVVQAIQQKTYQLNKVQHNYQMFKNTYAYLDDGNVTDKVIERVFTSKHKRKKEKKCAKKRLLIYPGGMKNNGITSSVINLLEN